MGLAADDAFEADYAAGVLRAAWAQAQARGARLQVVHAWRPLQEYDVAIGARVLASDWTRTTRDSLSDWVSGIVPAGEVEWAS